ncbi:hypothetical protein A3Q56_07343 [Intoshia linei]|uniref:Uncharacterized protein n=1 Tax=Intoshia linei TaxID=1819745 RepID=A0A177ASH5_9BILA|nr:hypothetical protein A3Q56_07343 [Intoshia linei]
MKEQAKILKKEMNSENCGGLKKFKASDGWLSQNDIDDFFHIFKDKLIEYEIKDILMPMKLHYIIKNCLRKATSLLHRNLLKKLKTIKIE